MSALKRPIAAVAEFLNNMDARDWRAVWVTVALLVIAGAMLGFGRLVFGDQIEIWTKTWLGGAERAHWGLPAALAIFTLAAYVGAPQLMLIAACVVAFGPERGFWYSWVATVFSGAATYYTGVWAGEKGLSRIVGSGGGRLSRFVGKNAFMASFIIRFVPTAPFIVVNMAMGAAGMRFLPFVAGLTLGVLPKTALVAFAGDGLMDALQGKAKQAAIAGGVAILVWIVGAVLVRRLVRKEPQGEAPATPIAPAAADAVVEAEPSPEPARETGRTRRAARFRRIAPRRGPV